MPGRSKAKKQSKKQRPPAKAPMYFRPPGARHVRLAWFGQNTFLETAANTGNYWLLRLNSVYDVDTNVASTAVPGFAEYATLFANYKVNSVKVKVAYMCINQSATAMSTFVVIPRIGTALPASPQTWPVQYMAKSTHNTLVTSGAANVKTIEASYKMHEIARVTKQQYDTDMDYSGVTNANPGRQLYLALAGFCWNSGVQGSFVVSATVSFDVEFFNPLTVSS